jgi:hypothetical protein
MDGVQALGRAFEGVTKKFNGKIAFITVIEPDSIKDSPDNEIRTAVAKLLKEHGTRIGGAAIIYEPKGLKATMIRMIISMINLISGQRFPSQVVSTVDSGVNYIVSNLRDELKVPRSRIRTFVNSNRVVADAPQPAVPA